MRHTMEVTCSDRGEVALTVPLLGRVEMTWMQAVDLAYSLRAAALVAASSIDVDPGVWKRVDEEAESATEQGLREMVEEEDE